MKRIVLGEAEYSLEKEYKNGFDLTELTNKYTDYFKDYDYILGDWAYNKLLLKGFCNKDNKLFNSINDYSKIDDYIKEICAYECKYFIIKKK